VHLAFLFALIVFIGLTHLWSKMRYVDLNVHL